MRRSSCNNWWVRRAAALFLAALCAAAAGAAAVGGEPPPNVVLIISDDQAWGDYGFMGHEQIETPHLDRLARQSLVFRRGYVPDSLCRPSLATMITGLYPHQHKITGNDPPLPKDRSKGRGQRDPVFLAQRQEMIDYIDKVPTLPRLLAKKGYLSHQSGKWWEGNHWRGGFTHGMTHGDPKQGGRHGDVGLKIGRDGLQPVFEFIDEAVRQEKPFFLWYAPFLPHTPHNPPERLLDKYRDKTAHLPVAKYWAMCEWFDETCGQLLGRLDERKLAENTLVLYVTDNGWINAQEASRYAPRSKRSPYEGGIRTPIMVRWPEHVTPGESDALANSIDLAPTVLAACELQPTEAMQGLNLLDAESLTGRKAIYGEIFEHNSVDIHDPLSSLQYRWCIDGRWKLIVPRAARVPQGRVELFDLEDDPHEKRDVAAEQPEVVARLQRQLDGWWPAAGR